MRLNERFSARASVLIINVLAKPGTPSSRQWPRLNSAISSSSITCVLADDHLRELVQNFFAGFVQFTNGGGVDGVNDVVGHAACSEGMVMTGGLVTSDWCLVV